MNYNDFPLFDDTTYSILQQKYNSQKKFDRKTIINKICFELEFCKNFCFNFSGDYNIKIISSINECKNNINTLLDNIKSSFTIEITCENTFAQFNIFKLVKKLINCISLFNEWYYFEEKEFYKILINNSLKTLIICLETIISACENSNIKFFKFM